MKPEELDAHIRRAGYVLQGVRGTHRRYHLDLPGGATDVLIFSAAWRGGDLPKSHVDRVLMQIRLGQAMLKQETERERETAAAMQSTTPKRYPLPLTPSGKGYSFDRSDPTREYVCSQCGAWKTIDGFLHNTRWGGPSMCKHCIGQRSAKIRMENAAQRRMLKKQREAINDDGQTELEQLAELAESLASMQESAANTVDASRVVMPMLPIPGPELLLPVVPPPPVPATIPERVAIDAAQFDEMSVADFLVYGHSPSVLVDYRRSLVLLLTEHGLHVLTHNGQATFGPIDSDTFNKVAAFLGASASARGVLFY